MKAFMYKVLSFVKILFLRLRVAVTLHIGHEKETKDSSSYEDEQKGV